MGRIWINERIDFICVHWQAFKSLLRIAEASSVCQTAGWCTIKAHFPSHGAHIHHPFMAARCSTSLLWQSSILASWCAHPQACCSLAVLQLQVPPSVSSDSWQESPQIAFKFPHFAQKLINKWVKDFSSWDFPYVPQHLFCFYEDLFLRRCSNVKPLHFCNKDKWGFILW